MSTKPRCGAELICDALQNLGINCVFGLPGSQNLALYEALRTSGLRTIVATTETSAAMMANGYYRSSGKLAALVTIPGPGFTWAIPGLAEAYLDSAALLHIVGQPANAPGSHYQLQAIDQARMAGPIVKGIHQLDHAKDIPSVVAAAHAQALAGEPGPVLIQVARSVLDERPPAVPLAVAPDETIADIDPAIVTEVARMLRVADHCIIFAGQGSHAAAADIERLATLLSAAVVTTTSGRGVIPEDHRLSLAFALGDTNAETLNALIANSDCVLAIGCKFSHNGSRGFELQIADDKLIHVDASASVLGANYPARMVIQADAVTFASAVVRKLGGQGAHDKGFRDAELDDWRTRGRAHSGRLIEPRVHGVPGGKPEGFFTALRRVLPRDACLVTDSGLHQSLVRRHFQVLYPRGLITPTNMQSMGFAIGAAIGAAIADPQRSVVAVLGDGGLAMSGLQLLAAVKQRLNLTMIVFVDGAYGLIRFQQLARSGHAFGTELPGMDIAALAKAVGAEHLRVRGDPEAVLRAAIDSPHVTIVEVALGDSLPMHWMHSKSTVRTLFGSTIGSRIRHFLRKR